MSLDRVLLPVEPADRNHLETIVQATIDVVDAHGATVYLLYLFPEDEYEELVEQTDLGDASGRRSPDELAARHESVRTPTSIFERHDIDYEIRGVVGGNPASQVVKRAEKLDADVVVVGGNKRSPTGKAMFGDHAQQVLLNASCPVVYVKRE
ncbi:MAG: universal stress protein [Natronomonas sp.]|uniref:universal stress protein n=1 Tax=Natronomonas sp. TaxID=2184060 RepID=UPI00286FC0CB|nr:universal stress protein [Natronomonas sp.]MDR9431654.1 universal stress protein [Natronomonas sp.]